MTINITDKLQGNQKIHGQRFINSSINSNFIIENLTNNLENLKSEINWQNPKALSFFK